MKARLDQAVKGQYYPQPHCLIYWPSTTLCSDTTSKITPFSRECFLRYYGGQLKTAVEQEAGEKVDCKR